MAINNRIFTILNQSGYLNEKQIVEAEALINYGEVSTIGAIAKVVPELAGNRILELLSEFYGIPVLDIDSFNLEYMPQNILPSEFLVANKVMPLAIQGKKLKLAVIDPTKKELFEAIAFKNGLILELILVDEAKLEQVINQNGSKYFKTIDIDSEQMQGDDASDNQSDLADMVNSHSDNQPVVKFVHKMILNAVQLGASDIHFEPYEKSYRVRYRIDGVLSSIATPPGGLKDKIAARIKVVSKLDISEKRVPQDGRLRLSLSKSQVIDFRVSTLPTIYGEKIVLRILDRKAASLGIESLGFDPEQKKIIIESINRPYGMILVTGPTGSGKTVTLYSCLNLLNDNSRNISTAEDPVEIQFFGINQVAINEKTGLNFASALRAFLRQDPDIIMVGEIRDKDTAEMAIKAAQTGHLVLSTLHTNDAPSALTRLVSMGIPTYNVGDAILTIIAQRLLRKLCPNCKKLARLSQEALLAAGFSLEEVKSGFQPFEAVGCANCYNLGYRGRIGVFEVMHISDELKRLILLNATSVELADQARREGVMSLRQSALAKVKLGITSLAEAQSTTNE